MIKTQSSASVTPIWRIGILVNMILYGVMTVIVSNNASGIHQLMVSHQQWLPWACVAALLMTFVCMAGAFDRHAKALWASYIMFNIALLWTETLMLASSMTPTQEKPDKTSVRYSAIAGSVFDLLVFMSSWRPRGAASTVKLHLGEAPAHVLPLLGEIIFNSVLISTLWGTLVILRNDTTWDWCYMRGWMRSLSVQIYLCVYAGCNAGAHLGWSVPQRLTAVYVWPVLGFVY